MKFRYLIKYLLYLAALIFLTNCYSNTPNQELLEEAIRLADSSHANYSEALKTLGRIKNTKDFNEAQKAKYNLYKVKTALNSGNRNRDTILDSSIEYFQNSNDTSLLFNTYYSKAFYNYQHTRYTTSLAILKKSEKLLPFFDDINIKLSFFNLKINNLLYLNKAQEAEDIAQVALKISQQSGIEKMIIRSTAKLANTQRYNNKPAESKKNYLIALEHAKTTEKTGSQHYILGKLIELTRFTKDYKEALRYAKLQNGLKRDKKDIPRQNYVKSLLFYQLGVEDSAFYYMKIAAQGNDSFVAKEALNKISEWHIRKKDYPTAFNRYNTANRILQSIDRQISRKSMTEAYEKEKLKNENNQLKIKQQKRNLLFVIVVTLLIILAGISYLFYYRKQRKQKEIYLKSKARQLEQENLLLKQSKEISRLREKEALLRESLFRRIDFLQKFPSVASKDKSTAQNSKRIALSKDDWAELKRTIDDAYPNFTKKLQENFPRLTPKDIYFCCFLKINVNLQDLSDIYCISKAAIIKKKYRIKTDKMSITDKTLSLDNFLKSF